MKKMSFEHKRSRHTDKKGFYIALAVCLIAIGASSASALNGYRKAKLLSDTSSVVSEASNEPSSTQKAAEIVSDVPYSSAPESSEPSSSELVSSGKEETAPYFILPVGGSILKNFDSNNLQYSETYKDWRLHTAVDIAAPKGTAVFSAADGMISDIYEDSLLGTVVKIDHGGGLIGYYCGMNSSPSVKKDQEVEAGYQIGAIGEIPSECVEETHLHFFMEKDGNLVSPLDYMGMMN